MIEQTQAAKAAVMLINKKADKLGNVVVEEFAAILFAERDFVSARVSDLLYEQAAEKDADIERLKKTDSELRETIRQRDQKVQQFRKLMDGQDVVIACLKRQLADLNPPLQMSDM